MTEPVDVGPMLALYMRMQQEQLRQRMAPDNSPPQRRRLTQSLADVFFDLIARTDIDLACEVGAHEGAFSQRLKRARPNTRIVAFEANPDVFDMHRGKLEGLGIEYYPVCVADRAGTTQMKVPVRDDAPLQRGEAAVARGGEPPAGFWPGDSKEVTMGSTLDFTPANRFELFECETVSLDGFLSNYRFERGALWVDVEGAASLVFEGAVETLRNCTAIYVELENQTKWSGQRIDAEVYQFLFRHGFVPVLADLQKSWQYNVILLKKDLITAPFVKRAALDFLTQPS